MRKTKTNKKIISIFSAIFGVVFAFFTGVTYCASSLTLKYGMNANSTSAYMANQQFQVINDTTSNPVPYGVGAHNFEVAIQYAVDYKFDLRVKYSLSWSAKSGATDSTENVVLNFANRDNIIYDEEYIFLSQSVDAGSGKITLITGAEFIELAGKDYEGRTLTITILDSNVKIYKALDAYPDEYAMTTEATMKDGSLSVAAIAWLQCKKNQTATGTTQAYAMVYNFRRNYEHGIPYPELETAYKKPVATVQEKDANNIITKEIGRVYGSSWAGGNRYYAGVGLYIVAGLSDLELEIQIGGTWRTSDNVELSFENNFQHNYTNEWDYKQYSSNNLWDIRSYKFKVPAKSSCYIEALDSIEITSAKGSTNPSSNYRLVTNEIIINPLSANFSKITYEEATGKLITYVPISSNVTTVTKSAKTDDAKAISIVNTTMYSNGLYDSYNSGKEISSQTYDGTIALINNTAETQQVTVSLALYFRVSNAITRLYEKDTYKRAIDYIGRTQTQQNQSQYSPRDAFNSAETITVNSSTIDNKMNKLYYSYTDQSSALSTVNGQSGLSQITIKLAPYSSANIVSAYEVGKGLSDYLNSASTGFDDPNTPNRKEYYDAWVYLVPTITAANEVSTDGNDESIKTNLMLETTQTGNATIISVKNNTNKTVTGIEVQNLVVKEYYETTQTSNTVYLATAPFDWEASYWKYYYRNGDQVATLPKFSYVTTENEFEVNQYWLKTKGYSVTSKTINYLNGFDVDDNDTTKIVDNNETKITLLPGESKQIASVATTEKVIVSGTCSATSVIAPSEVTIINNGTTKAYLVNYTTNAYYLRIQGNITATNFKVCSDGYSYYMGVLRPGQIIKLSLGSAISITAAENLLVSSYIENDVIYYNDFNSQILEDAGWDVAIADYVKYFNINEGKTSTIE